MTTSRLRTVLRMIGLALDDTPDIEFNKLVLMYGRRFDVSEEEVNEVRAMTVNEIIAVVRGKRD